MYVNVIYVGDIKLLDHPFVLKDDIIIPVGWYLLDNNLQDRPQVIYKNNNPIIIIEHVQINHNLNGNNYNLSIIKTDKKLKLNDILEIK